MTKKPTLSEQVKAPADKARELLGGFYKTVDVMKSAYSKSDRMMSVWADDLYAVEAVMSFLESIRDGDQATTWQTIETAPRDGTSIIVCDARVVDSQKVVYWDDDPAKLPWGWTVDDASISYHQDAFTHWQPIPAPPEPTR